MSLCGRQPQQAPVLDSRKTELDKRVGIMMVDGDDLHLALRKAIHQDAVQETKRREATAYSSLLAEIAAEHIHCQRLVNSPSVNPQEDGQLPAKLLCTCRRRLCFVMKQWQVRAWVSIIHGP